MNNLGSFGYVCWVEFPFHVLLLSSSSSLLWSWWIPDETPPRTLWCTPQLPCKKKKKKQQERLARNLSKEGVQVLILILFHASPNSQKKIILLTENGNPKHETIFLFVKFANCDNWIFRPESPVEKYVHFQTFKSCLILQNFNLSNIEPNKKQNKQWTITLTVNQILQTWYQGILFGFWFFILIPTSKRPN